MDGLKAWLAPFVNTKYFVWCSDCGSEQHTNGFCLNCCEGPLCNRRVCKAKFETEHGNHTLLQVRKASRDPAIRMCDIKLLVNLDGINQYRINGATIVFLITRPNDTHLAKGKDKPNDEGERTCYCKICKRILMQDVLFCSIQCKMRFVDTHPVDTLVTLDPRAAVGSYMHEDLVTSSNKGGANNGVKRTKKHEGLVKSSDKGAANNGVKRKKKHEDLVTSSDKGGANNAVKRKKKQPLQAEASNSRNLPSSSALHVKSSDNVARVVEEHERREERLKQRISEHMNAISILTLKLENLKSLRNGDSDSKNIHSSGELSVMSGHNIAVKQKRMRKFLEAGASDGINMHLGVELPVMSSDTIAVQQEKKRKTTIPGNFLEAGASNGIYMHLGKELPVMSGDYIDVELTKKKMKLRVKCLKPGASNGINIHLYEELPVMSDDNTSVKQKKKQSLQAGATDGRNTHPGREALPVMGYGSIAIVRESKQSLQPGATDGRNTPSSRDLLPVLRDDCIVVDRKRKRSLDVRASNGTNTLRGVPVMSGDNVAVEQKNKRSLQAEAPNGRDKSSGSGLLVASGENIAIKRKKKRSDKDEADAFKMKQPVFAKSSNGPVKQQQWLSITRRPSFDNDRSTRKMSDVGLRVESELEDTEDQDEDPRILMGPDYQPRLLLSYRSTSAAFANNNDIKFRQLFDIPEPRRRRSMSPVRSVATLKPRRAYSP